MKIARRRFIVGTSVVSVVAVASVAFVLTAAGSSPPARIWAGDYKELRWEATATQSEGDVCVDLALSGRTDALSGGCDFGLNDGDYVGYFADSNCEVDATWVVAPAHPEVARVEITAIVDEQRTKEKFDYARVLPAPEGFGNKFVVGLHRKYAYVDNIVVFDEGGNVLQERPSGLNVDHEWTPEDFC